MIPIKLSANVLLTALMTLLAVFFILFFATDKFIYQERLANHAYQQYLSNKFHLIHFSDLDENKACDLERTETVKMKLEQDYYRFYCEKLGLFIGGKPTKEKYIAFSSINEVLNIDLTDPTITAIDSLSELPFSSEQSPKIVIAKKAIDETLTQDFYGIIITDFYFDIKGNKKVYGILYSSFDNEREERNLSFKKNVIENLDNRYTTWRYLTRSRNLLHHE